VHWRGRADWCDARFADAGQGLGRGYHAHFNLRHLIDAQRWIAVEMCLFDLAVFE
jgi:hypothetical protein